MISTQSFCLSKFVAFLCLFGVVSATGPSAATAQQARRGAPPEAAPSATPAAPDAKPANVETKPAATPGMPTAEPPLPPDAHAEQTIQMDGKTLHYTAT